MATGIRESTAGAPRRSGPQSVVAYDEYVDHQLRRVMSYVRVSDLATGLLAISTYVVGALLVVALVDHWLFDLGRWGRFAAFVVIFGGLAYGLVRLLLPLVIRRVNPAYAALVVEHDEPSLKNSLLNYVFLRRQRDQLREVVYSAVEQQAATNLSQIDVEASVDHTPAVRFGIALAVIVAIFGLYAVLSPKDPFQTVARVVLPWSDQPRPSRVRIDHVKPGHVEVYAGRHMDVSAMVTNLGDGEEVSLVFDSRDGQIVSRSVTMKQSEAGQPFQVTIPGGSEGFYQDVDYRIVAGDAHAGPYHITIKPTPSIVVDRVEYEYPAYMNKSPATQEGDGNIRAPEGTRVTLFATSNQPIAFGYIEFDPDEHSTSAGGSALDKQPRPAVRRDTIAMKHEGTKAQVSFTLLMNEEARTGWHETYRLRFTNARNESNDQPILYQLDVIPDLAPLVEILAPARKQVAVPENGTLPIEVRAYDPDYGLTEVLLPIVQAGNTLAEVSLFNASASKAPEEDKGTSQAVTHPVTQTYDFRPRQLGLRSGDAVVFWAVARDNRCDPLSQAPAPRESKTMTYEVRIVEPRPGEAGEDGEGVASQPSDNPMPGDKESAEGQTADPQNNNSQAGNQRSGEQNSDAQQGDQQSGDAEQNGQQGRNQQGSGQQSSSEQRGGQQDGEQQGVGGQSGDATSGNSPSEQPQGESAQSSNNADGQGQSQNGARENGAGQPNASEASDPGASTSGAGDPSRSDPMQSGAGASDREASSADQTPSGESAAQGGNAERRAAEGTESGRGSERRNQPATRANRSGDPATQKQDPLTTDGSRDGDAVERILDRIRERTGKTPERTENGSDSTESQSPAAAEDAQGDRSNRQNPDAAESAAPTGENPPDAARGAPNDVQSEGTESAQRPQAADQKAQESGQGGRVPQGANANSGARPGDASSSRGAAESGDAHSSEQAADDPQDRPSSANPLPAEQSQSDSAARSTQEQPSLEQENGEPGEVGKQGEVGERGKTGEQNETGEQGEAGQESGDLQQEGQSDPNGQANSSRGAGESPQGASQQQSGTESNATRNNEESNDENNNNQSGNAASESSGQAQPDQRSPSEPSGDPNQTPRSNAPANQRPADSSPQSAEGGGGSPQQVGGNSATSQGAGDSPEGDGVPSADEANMEYARRATDLVLDYLKHDQNRQDRELLERLGWSPEDVAEFVKRWEQLKRDAGRNDAIGQASRRELDNALKSLGLSPSVDHARRAGTRSDRIEGVRDSGRTTPPPSKYREQWQEFRRSISGIDPAK